MAAVDARPGQSATDHLLTHHLATSTVLTPGTNSLSRPCPRPSVRDALSMPTWRELAAQRAQSACAVPVHQHLF
jgi:hypothetical protein